MAPSPAASDPASDSTSDPASDAAPRESSQPAFWDERYRAYPDLFSAAPNAIVAAEADRLTEGAEVLEVAAGEGRNARFFAQRGHPVTALDFAPAGLEALQSVAAAEALPITCVCADILTWAPERRWDAIVVTFLQLLPDERPRLFARLRGLLQPGGVLIGVFFRPEHHADPYADVGPPVADRMVSPAEVREYLPEAGLQRCAPVDRHLDEGRIVGLCALTVVVYEAPGEPTVPAARGDTRA